MARLTTTSWVDALIASKAPRAGEMTTADSAVPNRTGGQTRVASREASTREAGVGGMPASAYFWIIFFSALDVILTWFILHRFAHMGGREVNVIALAIIDNFGFNAAILFKAVCVGVGIFACEFISRHNLRKGQRLILAMSFIAVLPVVAAAAQLLRVAVVP